jgi:hypothetical protein
MKTAKIVVSRRSFLRQTSSAIGTAVAAPMIIPASVPGEGDTPSSREWATMGLATDKPAKASPGAAVKYAVLRSAASDGQPAPTLIDGIPYLRNTILTSGEEGGSASLSDLHIEAKHLYLFGCVNSVDTPLFPGGSGGADDFKNLFVGDKAADLRIKYRYGTVDKILLLFGYTLWWRDGHNSSPEPFKSDPGKQVILDRALCVAHVIPEEKVPCYLRIGLRDEPVLEIELVDDSGHAGHPVIDGITFADVSIAPPLDPTRFLAADGGPMPDGLSAWLASHTVASNDPMPRGREDALRNLSRVVYTFPEDIGARTINSTDPVDPKHTFSGPSVKFTGPPEAEILANVILENSIGLLGRVDDNTGMVHESAPRAAAYMGWVGYRPDLQTYYDSSYTRTHFIALLSNMGFLAKADKATDYFDRWMMYFPTSYPALQIGGKPVPGHATMIANKPHIYFDDFRNWPDHTWPEKFKTRDYGNPETDGHGILMLGRHRAWTKAGRTREWIERRWEAIHEAAEWIPWCLDNPQLSLSEHGLLYAESEGGMAIESLYCNVPCYFGLLAYAEMAEAGGRADFAGRWRAQAERLLGAMNAYFPATLEPWGDVWDPEKVGGWGLATAAVPILEAMELYGYDPVNRLPAGWAERSKRTYVMQSAKRSRRYCAPSTMGYGQGFITQSALLLDQMADATQMTAWMARFCFAPLQPHPYRVPEGVMMKSDGSMWARRGDLGNGFQMGGVLMACHVLLGIDDYDASTLKLMPRLPVGWTGVNVQKWPVQVLSSGRSEMAMLSVELARDKDCNKFDFKISVDKPVDNVEIRLGPFPIAAKKHTIKNYKRNANAILFESGDSKWAWVRIGAIHDSCFIQSQTE